MAEKKFAREENQRVWDSYYNNIMAVWTEENKELTNEAFLEKFNKKKISLLQYKPVAIAFEQYIGKSFNDITEADIEMFVENTDKKSKMAHLNAFLLTSVSNGYIKNKDSKFLISLLPKEYKVLGKMLAESKM